MRHEADAKAVAVSVQLPGGPAPARANPEQIQRVLFNLLQNAIRHTPPDGSVTVRAEPSNGVVEIEVADTGDGIAAGERDAVFEPFVQGRRDAARTDGSAGLGLAISRAIVEAHGGRIWLADAGADGRVLEPDRPPCASTIAREIARPSPARRRCARRRGAVERLEDARRGARRRSRRRCRRPRSRRRRRSGSARTVTLPSGGVWRIAFWIRLKSTRCSFSGLPRAARGGRELGAHGHGARRRRRGASPRPSRAAGSSSAHLLHRPAELAALQAGELEEVVDQRAERAHVGADARRVVAAVSASSTTVVDRVGQQLQRGDRRAQVVRDGGDEVAARAALLAVEPRDHRVDVGRQLGELVVAADAGAHVARALADGARRRARRRRRRSARRAERPHRPHGQRRRVGDDEDREERVVGETNISTTNSTTATSMPRRHDGDAANWRRRPPSARAAARASASATSTVSAAERRRISSVTTPACAAVDRPPRGRPRRRSRRRRAPGRARITARSGSRRPTPSRSSAASPGRLELGAQPADVDGDRRGVGVERVPPHVVHQLVARERAARVAGEEQQQVELALR